MCGISGFNWADQPKIETMNLSLKHRGPDGDGIYVDEQVSLGHTRLAIIDLSEKGKQPMSNEDGSIWLVYNGEIYNFKEIRKELEQKGHVFRSNSDTEIIIHAFEEWQFDCLDRFNGMFAFAIYDSRKKTIFLARDRFGVKPLYYYYDEKRFIFSSEIKGILCHSIPKEANDSIIYEYLFLSLLHHREETFFKGIHRLLPGHYLVYDCRTHSLSRKQWYKLPLEENHPSQQVTPEELKHLFIDSVRLRMVADVPVGSCLSGGLDSSAIVGAMRKLSPEGDLRTFSVVFPGLKLDESEYIKEAATFTSSKSFVVHYSEEDLMSDLADIVRTQEEPFSGPSIYAQYQVMKLAHENGMKVLLDGQGGDELFGGYIYYFGFYFYELFKSFKWHCLSKEMLLYLIHFKNPIPFEAFAFLLLPKQTQLGLWKTRVNWISDDLYQQFSSATNVDPRWSVKSLNEGLVNTLLTTAIPHLLSWEDKNSMRWSVETRLPFLDYRFVEKVVSLPPGDKLRNGVTKHIFRQAASELIPARIAKRRDKIGFAVPRESWLGNPEIFGFIGDLVMSQSFAQRPYWNHLKIRRQFDSSLKGRPEKRLTESSVWKWINLELWLRHFMD